MNDLQFLRCEIEMPFMSLPVRTTYLRTPMGGILVSPGSTLTRAQLQSVGPVTEIVAPSLLHCAGVQLANMEFPKARIWGVPGAREAKPEIAWTDELTRENWPFHAILRAIPLEGAPKVRECLLLHERSGSLIVTDAAFNIRDTRGVGAYLMLHLFGTYGRFAVSRLFARFVKDKAAFERSLGEVFAHDFDRIVVTHGENVEEGGKELFRQSLAERGFVVPHGNRASLRRAL